MRAAGGGLPVMVPGQGAKEEDPLLHKTVESGSFSDTEDRSWAEVTYQLMEDHSSSTMATVICYTLVFCIILSTAFFVIETLPSVESNRTAVLWLYAAECLFVIVFSIEYLLRLWSTLVTGRQSFCTFFMSPMNLIDLLSVLPWYVAIILMLLASGDTTVDLRALRTCRLVRLLKIGRFAPQLRAIGCAMERSVVSLFMLLGMMAFALIFFSTLIWLVERGHWDAKQGCYARDIAEHDCSPFDSIPGSSWWVITTITTVGYGDVFPKTVAGKLVGSLCMMFGILAVAMPTTVLGVQFADAYQDVVREEREEALRKAEAADMVKHDTRRNALSKGLRNMEEIQAKLALTMHEIERKLMMVSAADPKRQKSIKSSYGPLSAFALQSMDNTRRFLESYQS